MVNNAILHKNLPWDDLHRPGAVPNGDLADLPAAPEGAGDLYLATNNGGTAIVPPILFAANDDADGWVRVDGARYLPSGDMADRPATPTAAGQVYLATSDGLTVYTKPLIYVAVEDLSGWNLANPTPALTELSDWDTSSTPTADKVVKWSGINNKWYAADDNAGGGSELTSLDHALVQGINNSGTIANGLTRFFPEWLSSVSQEPGWWSTSNRQIFTVNGTGLYLVQFSLNISVTSADGYIGWELDASAASTDQTLHMQLAGTFTSYAVSGTFVVYLSNADTVRLALFNQTGQTVTINASALNKMSVVRLTY
ncbi:MAG: hypothetical protein OHK0046_46120 [Anaerolineae bacterium]